MRGNPALVWAAPAQLIAKSPHGLIGQHAAHRALAGFKRANAAYPTTIRQEQALELHVQA